MSTPLSPPCPHLRPPPCLLPPQVITAESTYSNWSLFNRLCLANEVLDAAALSGETVVGVAWVHRVEAMCGF